MHSETFKISESTQADKSGIDGNSSWSRQGVWFMFDRIARRYDLLNHLLSGGQDMVWRKKVARYLPNRDSMAVMDLATGTADQLISLVKSSPNISSALGMDMAEKMLDVARQKIVRLGLQHKIKLLPGDAMATGQPDKAFDVVTISFGIRNISDVPRALSEMHRILNDGGRMLILEFSLPGNSFLRNVYLFYFRHILPRIGSLISGDSYAYNYLNKTVETFPYGTDFCKLLSQAGFKNIVAHPLTFGIASIYCGEK